MYYNQVKITKQTYWSTLENEIQLFITNRKILIKLRLINVKVGQTYLLKTVKQRYYLKYSKILIT